MTNFRIQFLGSPTDQSVAVLEERDLLAASVSEAIEATAAEHWPPDARAYRIVDLDGREVFHRNRADDPDHQP
jgi:hypothetical protein